MLRRTLGGLAFVLAIVACASSKSDQEQFASDYCALLSPCCVKAGKSGDTASCKQLFAFGGGFDKNKGEACLADRRAHQNDPAFCDTAFVSTGACGGVFQTGSSSSGTAKPGEKCEFTSDCANDPRGTVRCTFTTNRICQLDLDGNEGDAPCLGTRDTDGSTLYTGSASDTAVQGYICDKGKGLFCDEATQKCARLGDVGASCLSSSECVKTAACKGSVCTARVPVGADCDSFTGDCVLEARCDTTTKKCVPLLADGAVCTESIECTSRSCANGKCGPAGAGIGSALGAAFFCGN